jgi:hypothetical protein
MARSCEKLAALIVAFAACSSSSTKQGSSEGSGSAPAGSSRIEPRVIPEPAVRSGPRKRSTVDTRPFSRACKADTDCRLVDTSPCNRCTCASMPLAATDERAFADAAAAIHCEGVQIYPCVDCPALVPVCVEGECSARSTEPVPQGGECQTDHDCVVSCVQLGRCCTEASCETTIARSKARSIENQLRERCTPAELASCPRVEQPEYIAPRCRRGVCFGEFLER